MTEGEKSGIWKGVDLAMLCLVPEDPERGPATQAKGSFSSHEEHILTSQLEKLFRVCTLLF